MVDPDRVGELLVAAEAYLDDVRRFAAEVGGEGFLAERGEQYRIEFPLQQAIQIATGLANRLAALARLRNLLVHRYAELDPVRVWDLVTTNLTDVDAFLAVVAAELEA